MRPTDVNSNALLRKYLDESACEVRSLGKVMGGYDVLCAVAGGAKEPAIVITAGAHADELGGVYGALTCCANSETEHRLYVIPVRDPFGFEGYRGSIYHASAACLRLEPCRRLSRVPQSGQSAFRGRDLHRCSNRGDDSGHDVG